MTISQLTSRNNSLLKTLRLISSGSRRAPKDLAVSEGIRVLEELNKSHCTVEAVVISERFGNSCKEEDLLNVWLSKSVPVYRVSDTLFMSVSDVKTPQGAVALVRFPELVLDKIPAQQNALVLFACGIQDPGNLGTLIRTAVAAGATSVCATRGTVSARNPKTIRASAGAIFRIPVIERVDITAFINYCRLHSIKAYRTDVSEGLAYTRADLASPCAIVLGNEGSGIGQEQFAELPAIHIPMSEGVESLNVAMAGGIFLYEAWRQRSQK